MIISKSRDSSYQIIYPVNPTPSLIFAASELKKYIFAMTGAAIPEFQDNRHTENAEIVIGYTNRGGYSEEDRRALGDEGFIIKNDGEKVLIIGSGVRGALYGVYSFLEDFCGCRFYTNDFEVVPHRSALEIAHFDEVRHIPVFGYRNSYWHSVTDPYISAKLKINGCHGRKRFPAEIGGDINYEGGFEHTIGWLSGQCPFGSRAWVQPCLSDEKTYETVIGNLRKMLKEHPDTRLVSITQNDGDTGACKCDKCRAVNDAEESEMGTMLRFVNRAAKELGAEYPDVMFDTFAYRFTRKPPKLTRPESNVIVRLCSIECCFRHPLDTCTETPGHDGVERSFAEDIEEWSHIAPNLYIWNYTTNFTNFSVLFPDYETLRRNVRYFADHGAKGLFEQGNFASPNGEFGELKGYMIARLLWDPYMSEEKYNEYFNEFLRDYYGAGAQHIADYIKMALDGSENEHFGIYYDNPSNYIWVRECGDITEGQHEFIRRGNALFDAAEADADSDRALYSVRRSRIQLMDYTDFVIRDELFNADDSNKSEIEARLIANNKMKFEYMRKNGVTYNHEFHDINSLSDPDFKTHALLWKRPDEEQE